MRVGSLFSGAGGLDHGLHRAGLDHAFLCESDEWRRGVLSVRFPGVPIYDDVREVTSGHHGGGRHLDGELGGADAERARVSLAGADACVDLLCGGFPCQDVSVAGNRAGLAGERSGLFYEFARVAGALRPGWVLIENVPGLLSSNGGRDFGSVLGTMADLGYGLGWRVLDSRFFGVPQRRRRVFIVGALAVGDPRAAAERAGQVLAVGARCAGHPPAGGEARSGAAVASLSGLGTGGPDDNDGQGGRLVSYALNAKRGNRDDGESETFVTHALTSEGHDASEDGTGRGTPLVAAPLSHGSNPNSNAAGRRREDDENLVAYPLARRGRSGGSELEIGEEGVYNALRAGDGGSSRLNQVMVGQAVRRLMPVECERLQDMPDGWTDIPWAGKPHSPDSRRYAALGDMVTASVAEWLGRRLLLVEAENARAA